MFRLRKLLSMCENKDTAQHKIQRSRWINTFPLSFQPQKITGHAIGYIGLGSHNKIVIYPIFLSKMQSRNLVIMKSTFSEPKIFMISFPQNFFWIGYYSMSSGSLIPILREWEACNEVVVMNLILKGWECDMHSESP